MPTAARALGPCAPGLRLAMAFAPDRTHLSSLPRIHSESLPNQKTRVLLEPLTPGWGTASAKPPSSGALPLASRMLCLQADAQASRIPASLDLKRDVGDGPAGCNTRCRRLENVQPMQEGKRFPRLKATKRIVGKPWRPKAFRDLQRLGIGAGRRFLVSNLQRFCSGAEAVTGCQ